jgi:hypothetical protein
MHASRFAVITFLLITGIIGTGPLQVYADQVIMTNGDRVSGKFISFSQTAVNLSTPHSGTIQIDRKQIQQLVTDSAAVVELVSGERIIGRISPGEGRVIVITSIALGERMIPIDLVRTIRAVVLYENPDKKTSSDDMQRLWETWTDKSTASSEVERLSNQSLDVRGRAEVSLAGSEKPEAKPVLAIQQPKSLGQRPEDEDDIRKIFLRQATVLLQPLQAEVEAGLNYLRNQSLSSILNAKIRQFQLPLAARIGLLDGVEGFFAIPIAYVQQELSFAGDTMKQNKWGFGDATAGFNAEIFRETAHWPEIIAAASLRAPTGGTPQEEAISLGSGHWSGGLGVQFIKTADPVILFWGINYTHEFPAQHFSNDGMHKVRPGETIGYNFGFGFAVNENVSLSTQVSGSYQGEAKADGIKISGSSSEPVGLRAALTYRYSKNTFIEPSLSIGLDDDSPDFVLGVSATHRFGK